MKFEAIYTNESDIPEDIKENFVERGGKWELNVAGLKTEGDVERLKEAARKEREDHDTTKTALRELKVKSQANIDELDILKSKGGDGDREPTNAELLKLRKLERDNEALTTSMTELTAVNEQLTADKNNTSIAKALRKDAKGLIRGDAVEDTVKNVIKNFTLSDDSCLTKADLGAMGGMKPRDFLESYVKERPYLAPTSKSGGVHGSRSKGSANDGEGPMATKDWLATQGIG